MGPWLFWTGVVVAVALLLLAAKLYDRRHRNPQGEPGAGLSQNEVLDQESARANGNYRNAPWL
ncbi:MAG TPA: hypothetical protein VFZ64_15185 [Nocardioidaceae bacterium]